ncbi:hypothetical protein PC129_g7231 [Phytophthora cactorum]|uniref:Uncharacterized protein n=1 Tax=Phytophthora cactorum TaxID=29920 RepID=A0A329SKR0_9STRA|nr:hypothetical protein Pcac1_g14524 [Phytophthora cactorum]KAG2839723.1 hypothetical protein PC112_g4012 [Phytophthora cactorum]KAG2841961.1 hypothetical protein PC111_g2932 [Phytophthora cactorum]KAG2865286.1 hypothetical protein PC113_g3837 [Phytophthora cactorum]KAG2925010.1 hypothetical protein PC114_g4291 [Phytophthora cactorum]
MVDRLIHNRVFKVSKELNRLDLLCEQHRRQIGHREGLPDWERPNTPAGKASGRHGRTPAFFAWDEGSEHRPRPTWQTETPQKVARTLHLTPTRGEREKDRQPAPERSPHENVGEDVLETATSLPSEQVELEGMDEASAIEVDRDDRSVEEEQPVGTGRTIAVSPIREDILDRVHPPNARTSVSSRNLTLPLTVEAAPSPYHPPSSPRYRHGRRLQANDAAIPTPRAQQYAAGVTTQQADRYRMSRTSGKRFRSPAKPTTLWDDLCNTYIHQSAASSNTNTNPTSFSRKRTTNSAAERAFGGSSVFPTVNTDTYGWPGSESSGFNRRPVLTGSEAMNVANHAVREFLGGRDEETNQSEPPMESRQRSGESDRVAGTVELPGEVPNASTTGSRTGNNRKSKRVSFGGDSTRPQPRTLPVLADKTTQTEDSLLPARPQVRAIPRDPPSRDSGSPVRCPACDTVVDESGRPRKVPRSSTSSDAAAAPAQQRIYRRTSSHVTNPIMTNPRYPTEPMTFRGRSTYSSAFDDRLAWR